MDLQSFHLHPNQRDILLDQLINKDSPHYNIGGVVKIKGNLDRNAFKGAVRSLPQVFDCFQMRFELSVDAYLVHADTDFKEIEVNEISFRDHRNPAAAALSWAQEQFNKPFEIRKDTLLFQHILIDISPDELWFFRKYHHLIIDGFGFFVENTYLAKKYFEIKYSTGGDPSDTYGSYRAEAETANDYFKSPSYKAELEYWEGRVPEMPARLFTKKRGVGQSKSGFISARLTLAETKAIADLGTVAGASLQQITLAALVTLLGRSYGIEDVVFGVPIHRRNKTQQKIVGLFTGIIPFVGKYDPSISVVQQIKDVAAQQRRDYRNKNVLLGELSRKLSNNSNSGMIDILLNHEFMDFEFDFRSEVSAETQTLSSESEVYPMHIRWREHRAKNELELRMNFRYDYFSDDEAERWLQRIRWVIGEFAKNPDLLLGDVDILPTDERKLLVNRFSKGRTTSPHKNSVMELFERHVSESPGKIALIFRDHEVSYKELKARVDSIAVLLKKQGVATGTFVPICMFSGIELIATVLAVIKLGATVVPVNPEFPAERVEFILKDVGASVAVGDRAGTGLLKDSGQIKVIDIQSVGTHAGISENLTASVSPEDIVFTLYTSGSTGLPKGVMIKHGSLMNVVNGVGDGVNFLGTERFLSVTAFSFDIFYLELFLPLTRGATIVLASREQAKDGFKLLDLIKKSQPTFLQATPSTWINLINCGWSNQEKMKMMIGGESFDEELKLQLTQRGEIWNLYGPTETTIYSTMGKLDQRSEVSIGHPIDNTSIYILDERQRLIPVGAHGEICITGAGLAKGYLNLAELTGKKFIENPVDAADGKLMYRTGDIGRWLPGGNIEFLGRNDDQVKIRGVRIELNEIRNALTKIDLVSEYFLMVNKENSEGTLACFFVPTQEGSVDEIRARLKKSLPEYMIPTVLAEIASIPRLSNGKVDRKTLWNKRDVKKRESTARSGANEVESLLIKLYSEILNVSNVHLDDDFFNLGGHSILATKLSVRLKEKLDIEIPVTKIFEYPLVKDLAYFITKMKGQPRQSPSNYVEVKL